MTVTKDIAPKKRFKIKFPSLGNETEPRTRANGFEPKLTALDGQDHISVSVYGNKNETTFHRYGSRLPNNEMESVADNRNAKMNSPLEIGEKRAASVSMNGPKAKRQRLDCRVWQQCGCILQRLMSHPAGWIFNQPVDPVALNIPDYFDIVSQPMDLGTIKSKLARNMYFSTEEFVGEVRLTFSNAMLYNPPSNYVHVMARKLNHIFDTNWKLVEAKMNRKSLKHDKGTNLSLISEEAYTSRQNLHTGTAFYDSSSNKPISFEERQKLKKELLEISRRKFTPTMRSSLQKLGLTFQNQEEIEFDIDMLDDTVLLGLKRLIRNYSWAGAAEVKGSKTAQKTRPNLTREHAFKDADIDNQHACCFAKVKPPLSLVACKSGSSGSATPHHDRRRGSSEEISCGTYSNETVSHNQQDDPLTNGPVTALNEELMCQNNQLTASAMVSPSTAESSVHDVQLSPNKALRAAMLRSRFADTILKAQQQTLLSHGGADPAKLQQEKERLEKRQREEKDRIEAQIRAAKAKSQLKATIELKTQREKEREAARIALIEMEKTVEIDDNFKLLKDLEMLTGCSLYYFSPQAVHGRLEDGHPSSPLEQLGLFIKDEYTGYDDDEEYGSLEDCEEGEICC